MRKILNVLLGVLWLCLVLGASLFYQLRHGNWIQALAAAVLVLFVFWSLFDAVRKQKEGRNLDRGRYLVGQAPARRNLGTVVLIVLCTVASVTGWLLPHDWYINEGTIGRDAVLVHHQWWRLVTSVFLHANTTHLWMNMAALWYIGAEIETLLGTPRLLAIYSVAAIGGDAGVIIAGQDHTLGASGAIYGLMGATMFFCWKAWKHRYQETARRLLIGSGLAVAINLLFTIAIPHISLAAHLGGLIAGFFAAAIFAIPERLRFAWALTDASPKGVHYTCDANGAMYYLGPARWALEQGWVLPRDLATAQEKNVVPQLVFVCDADPDQLLITCAIPEESLSRVHMRDDQPVATTV